MRLVSETGGNPLAIKELAAGLGEGRFALGSLALLPLTKRLESHFLAKVADLPVDTRTLLLLAAADSTNDVLLLTRACEALGISLAAADPAIAVGVLTLEPKPTFRHPLIRSAVYSGATAADRRRAHDVLATATDIEEDPDRRAWHQAAAAVGPNAAIADRLETAAERASARGGYAMRAAFLARAADLSAQKSERSRRSLAAAQAYMVADEPKAAQHRLDDALIDLHDPMLLILAQRAQAALEMSSRPARVPKILLKAIREASAADPISHGTWPSRRWGPRSSPGSTRGPPHRVRSLRRCWICHSANRPSALLIALSSG